MTATTSPPESILIIGAGVFGLATADTLSRDPYYATTRLTLLDRSEFPNPHGASIDTSRIVRADYADELYAKLAAAAQKRWRQTEGEDAWGGDGRYSECGLCFVASSENESYLKASLANMQAALASELRSYGDGNNNANATVTSNSPLVELPSKAAIAAAMGLPSDLVGPAGGDTGYLNRRSGWADAERSMRWLRARVAATQRVQFVQGEAAQLERDEAGTAVRGARLVDGRVLRADVTVLAAGAWTPALLDCRGVASARVQCMAYVPLSKAEAVLYKDIPVLLDLSSGCFFFPPTRATSAGATGIDSNAPAENNKDRHANADINADDAQQESGWEIKVARHAFGYTNPIAIDTTRLLPIPSRAPDPINSAKAQSPPPPSSPPLSTTPTSPPKTTKISLPPPATHPIPAPDTATLLAMLHRTLPSLLHLAPTSQTPNPNATPNPIPQRIKTRTCTYLDTRAAHWLVTGVPGYGRSLVLATGGSGHAFKFLPVLGGCVGRVLGQVWRGGGAVAEEIRGEGIDGGDGEGDMEMERVLRALVPRWRWPGGLGGYAGDDGEGEVEDGAVWCYDGSRAGVIGEVLSEAMARGVSIDRNAR